MNLEYRGIICIIFNTLFKVVYVIIDVEIFGICNVKVHRSNWNWRYKCHHLDSLLTSKKIMCIFWILDYTHSCRRTSEILTCSTKLSLSKVSKKPTKTQKHTNEAVSITHRVRTCPIWLQICVYNTENSMLLARIMPWVPNLVVRFEVSNDVHCFFL